MMMPKYNLVLVRFARGKSTFVQNNRFVGQACLMKQIAIVTPHTQLFICLFQMLGILASFFSLVGFKCDDYYYYEKTFSRTWVSF